MNNYSDGFRLKIRQVAKVLADATTIWLFPHEDPDGDAFGSTIAMLLALRAMRKKARAFTYNDIPRMYRKLPGLDDLDVNATLPDEMPDVVLVLDNAEWERVGDSYREQLAAMGIEPHAGCSRPMILNVDHHISNTQFGDINLVCTDCAATGILVYDLLLELGVALTPDIITNIYVALITDTGRFSFRNTDRRAFEVAGELTALGVEPAKIIQDVYYTRSPQQMRLFGLIFGTLTEVPDLGAVYAWQTKQMLEETITRASDTEGAIDLMRTIGDYPLSLFFKENHKGVKVSIRSKSNFNAATFALRFAGGGHAGAAGFTVYDTMENAIRIVLDTLGESLAKTA